MFIWGTISLSFFMEACIAHILFWIIIYYIFSKQKDKETDAALIWILACRKSGALPPDLARFIARYYIAPEIYFYHPVCGHRMIEKARTWWCHLLEKECEQGDFVSYCRGYNGRVGTFYHFIPVDCCSDPDIVKAPKGLAFCISCEKFYTSIPNPSKLYLRL